MRKKRKQIVVPIDEALAIDHSSIQSLLDNTQDLIWSVDRNFKLIASNNAFDEQVRRTSGRIMRKGSDVLAEGIHFMMLYVQAFSGESFKKIEYVNTSEESWSEITFYPIHKGLEVIGVACYSRDITISQKEDRHLKLLESVVTNATDAILITDESPFNESGARIMYVNDALIKMTGYSRAEIIGKPLRILYGPKSDNIKLEHLSKCFTEKRPCNIEIINYKKNGEEFWLHLTMSPVIDNDGKFTHFIAIGRDVTERLQNIEFINEQNIKLKDIAWVQSHNVRGPLARIMGLLYLLENHLHDRKDDLVRSDLISHLRTSADELDSIIRSIVTKAIEEKSSF